MRVGHSAASAAATDRLVLAISAAVETLLGRRRANIAVALEPAIRAAVARWERDWRLERQRAGIARAQAAGKYRGRKPTIDAAEIRRLSARDRLPSPGSSASPAPASTG
jgi:hypothetical protein